MPASSAAFLPPGASISDSTPHIGLATGLDFRQKTTRPFDLTPVGRQGFAALPRVPINDELVNQDVKSNALRDGKAKDKSELMSKTRSFMRSRQRRPEKVKRYFDGKHVAHAKASWLDILYSE